MQPRNGPYFLFDSETGAYRSEVFNHLLEREVRRALRYPEFLVVLLVDPGDQIRRSSDPLVLLRLVADNIRREMRLTDIVGRLDDMLGIALPCVTVDDARLVAARVQARVRAVIQTRELSVIGPAVVSIGGAGFPRSGSSATALIQASIDAVRRAATHSGGDVVIPD